MSGMAAGVLLVLVAVAALGVCSPHVVQRHALWYLDHRQFRSRLLPISPGHERVCGVSVIEYVEARGVRRALRLISLVRHLVGVSTLGLLFARAGEYRSITKAASLLALPTIVLSIPMIRQDATLGEIGTAVGNIAIALALLLWGTALTLARGDAAQSGPRGAASILIASMAIRAAFVASTEDMWTSFAFYGFRAGLGLFAGMLIGIHHGRSSAASAPVTWRRYWCWWLVAVAAGVQGLVQIYEITLRGSDLSPTVVWCRVVIALVMFRLAKDIYDQQHLDWSGEVLHETISPVP